ncbi:MAG: hypothetical protein RLZZ156_499 [Deinococcota bacterium]|jgi:hypothetical protein
MAIANNVIADRVPGDTITASMFNQVKNGLAPEIHAARHKYGELDELKNVGVVNGIPAPAAPTIIYNGGAGSGANLTPISQSIKGTTLNTITFEITYSWDAIGNTQFTCSPPVGWAIMNCNLGVYRSGGSPVQNGKGEFPNGLIYNFLTSDHILIGQIELVKI